MDFEKIADAFVYYRVLSYRSTFLRPTPKSNRRFGPGPHKVEIQIEYPQVSQDAPPENWPRVRKSLFIEMAPLDIMPHSVNLFLQQVHHELWDGCTLIKNAKHIMEWGPYIGDSNEQRNRDRSGNFLEIGLDKVSYQEYSDQYPHVQWTVGFSGRPGGPDFYINKYDNSLIHGPGGQTHPGEDLHYEADPCFGKIVEGMEVVDEINLIPTDPENGYAALFPVMIVSASIVTEMRHPIGDYRGQEVKEEEQPQMHEQQPEQKARNVVDHKEDIMIPLPEVAHGI